MGWIITVSYSSYDKKVSKSTINEVLIFPKFITVQILESYIWKH